MRRASRSCRRRSASRPSGIANWRRVLLFFVLTQRMVTRKAVDAVENTGRKLAEQPVELGMAANPDPDDGVAPALARRREG